MLLEMITELEVSDFFLLVTASSGTKEFHFPIKFSPLFNFQFGPAKIVACSVSPVT